MTTATAKANAERIDAMMRKFDDWGMTQHLTEADKNALRDDLSILVSHAIHDAGAEVKNLFHALYSETKP